MAFSIFTRSSPPRRVIVVAHSCRVLATDPCWHSFSQRHVTTSQHNSEARVPFRCADWPSAAEARLKRSALIGRRPINSDCHVLVKGAEHNEALWWRRHKTPGTEHSQGWPHPKLLHNNKNHQEIEQRCLFTISMSPAASRHTTVQLFSWFIFIFLSKLTSVHIHLPPTVKTLSWKILSNPSKKQKSVKGVCFRPLQSTWRTSGDTSDQTPSWS